jgi:hypothetical protein
METEVLKSNWQIWEVTDSELTDEGLLYSGKTLCALTLSSDRIKHLDSVSFVSGFVNQVN